MPTWAFDSTVYQEAYTEVRGQPFLPPMSQACLGSRHSAAARRGGGRHVAGGAQRARRQGAPAGVTVLNTTPCELAPNELSASRPCRYCSCCDCRASRTSRATLDGPSASTSRAPTLHRMSSERACCWFTCVFCGTVATASDPWRHERILDSSARAVVARVGTPESTGLCIMGIHAVATCLLQCATMARPDPPHTYTPHPTHTPSSPLNRRCLLSRSSVPPHPTRSPHPHRRWSRYTLDGSSALAPPLGLSWDDPVATPQWNFLDLLTSEYGLLTRRSQVGGLESYTLEARGWFYGGCRARRLGWFFGCCSALSAIYGVMAACTASAACASL